MKNGNGKDHTESVTRKSDPLAGATANAALRFHALAKQFENVSVGCRGLGSHGRKILCYDVIRALDQCIDAHRDAMREIEIYARECI